MGTGGEGVRGEGGSKTGSVASVTSASPTWQGEGVLGGREGDRAQGETVQGG